MQKPFEFSGEFTKVDEEQQLVYGWASVIEDNGRPVVDSQGDVISPRELVKAAHNFVTTSRAAKQMHQGGKVGEIIESVVFTDEMQKVLGINLGKVGWWVGMKIHSDDVWKRVKSGELREFSIGGRGQRVDRSN